MNKPRHAWVLVVAVLSFIDCDQATSLSELFSGQGTWALQSLGVTRVSNLENFTITFGADGELGARVDCNVCGGQYEVKGNGISIEIQFCTEAFCGDGSLDREYLEALANTTRYSRQGSQLTLEYSGGTLLYEVSQ